MSVWAYEPEPTIEEELVNSGAVQISYASERRQSFHETLRNFSCRFPLNNAEMRLAQEKVLANPVSGINFPVWTEKQQVDTTAASAVINCDVSASFKVGNDVILWSSSSVYSTGTIDTIGANSITLTGAVGVDYAGVWLMPLATSFVSGWDSARVNKFASVLSATFETLDLPDLDTGAEVADFPYIDGTPSVPVAYVSTNLANLDVHQVFERNDTQFGSIEPVALRSVIESMHSTSVAVPLSMRHALLQFLHNQRGPDGEFWAPEPFGNHLVASNTATEITVPKVAADPANLIDRWIVTTAGDARQVTAAVNSGSNQVLTVATISGTIPEVFFMRKYRLATDRVRLRHNTRFDQITCEFACFEVSV